MRPRPFALILSLWPTLAGAEALELIGSFAIRTDSVIGISGIEVAKDGNTFMAIGDKGWWVEGRFTRRGEVITGVDLERIEPIIGQDGFPVAARRVGDWADSEGLAIAPDGTAWISFEQWAHVWQFDEVYGQAQWIEDHPTFQEHAVNWQLEAAAIDPEGNLYVFSEKPLIEGFPIYRLGEDRKWVIDGYLPEQDVFAIVGADFDEDGSLYLLERKLVVGIWWQSRVRRVRLDGSEDIVLWASERGEYDNLEGLSVWRDERGTRLTLVSDNNGGAETPTEFVEFRLTE